MPMQWPKLSGRLAATGVTEKDIDLMRGSKVTDSQQARYCSVLTALYREAAAERSDNPALGAFRKIAWRIGRIEGLSAPISAAARFAIFARLEAAPGYA